MSTYNLKSFLRPASVAIVTATCSTHPVGALLARNLTGFQGQVFRVDRSLDADSGSGFYPTIARLPAAPELAILALPARSLPPVITALGRCGTRAAVVLPIGSMGDEAGALDARLGQRMLANARRTGLRIVGPGSVGVLAPTSGLNASLAESMPPAGQLAFLSQSGAVFTTLIDWAETRRIGFSVLASLGRAVDVDVADWLDYLATDIHTGAILLYLESVSQPRKFLSALRHAARMKPVIALKSGRSPEIIKSAAWHSGSRALGGDMAFDAALQRAGAQRVPTLRQMLEAAETLARAQPVQGERLAILTNGGAMGLLAADQLLGDGGHLANLTGDTLARLDAVLPRGWSHGNPIDMLGDADLARYRDTLAILLEASEVDAIAAMYCPAGLGDPLGAARAALAEVNARPSHKPVMAAWLGSKVEGSVHEIFAQSGISNFETPEALARGFMDLVERHRRQMVLSQTVPAFPLRGSDVRGAVHQLIDAKLRAGIDWLDEADAKELLALAGFDVNATRRARTPEKAAAVARALPGPYAVKILSRDLAHKSDVGGVVLDVATPEDVGDVSAHMLDRVRMICPHVQIAGVSVQTMVQRAYGYELIARMVVDPVFGPIIAVGAGGVAVEALSDVAVALPPLDANLAQALIGQTRISRVLSGAGGHLPAVDMNAVQALLIRLSELACEFDNVAEIDLNPVLASPDSVIILDARVRLQTSHGKATDRLAIVPYPRELERPFELGDGTPCVLRPVRAEDEIPMREAFQKLSPEHRYMRFFHALNELPHELAARATQIDYDREMAFVLAEDKPAGQAALYGDVSLFGDANHDAAEFAITVIDAQAGRGVGRRLMETIVDYARRAGIKEIFGEILSANTAMLTLARSIGFHLMPEGDGVVRASLVLGQRTTKAHDRS